LPFVVLFAIEFMVRAFSISRHKAEVTPLEAGLQRWYDLFLLLPFWRWLRIIPVTIKLYQTNLLNLDLVRAQINHDFVANFAEELTEVVGIRLIDQTQESIKRGNIARWLFRPESRRPYINVNNTNELKAIASRLLQLSVHQVLPKIRPDIEALLRHTIESTLSQSPVYQQIQNMPGVSQLTDRLATDMSQAAYTTATTLLEDPVVTELSNRILQNFGEALEIEVQKKHNVEEIQSLLVDLLEEIKINYVKGIEEAGVEKILDESQQIRRIIRR